MADRWTPVVAELRERFSPDTDTGEVEAYLASQGYDRRQIGEILSVLFHDRVVVPTGTVREPARDPAHVMPLRVQGPHERGRFAADAWGALIRLRGSGAVTLHEFEHLIERALAQVDGRISIADVRAMTDALGVPDPSADSERLQVH